MGCGLLELFWCCCGAGLGFGRWWLRRRSILAGRLVDFLRQRRGGGLMRRWGGGDDVVLVWIRFGSLLNGLFETFLLIFNRKMVAVLRWLADLIGFGGGGGLALAAERWICIDDADDSSSQTQCWPVL